MNKKQIIVNYAATQILCFIFGCMGTLFERELISIMFFGALALNFIVGLITIFYIYINNLANKGE